MPPRYRYLLSYSDVWDEIIPAIVNQYALEDTLIKISKNCDTIGEMKKRAKYLISLMDLPFRSKMFVFYIWGYQEIFEISDRDFLPLFADWVSAALKVGNLDHGSWIFKNDTVLQIINAYKAVKKGTEPENGIIDMEPWTIGDLYSLHPMGKDPNFWRDLLVEINLRLKHMHQNERLSKHMTAVIDGAY